ncbi:MAG TPA: outer membrane beta-barrel protein [Xanthobacteraceae bacterium]|nr:outer membrane beta-barrel protein [Xanthobacteraceae bacterium]
MKKSIACIVASLAFGMAGAMAEEMAVPPSQFITASVPYLAWTGFYVGINGGYAWGNSSVTFAAKDPAALSGTCGGGGAPKGQCINGVDFHRDGAVAGGQFGYNWQVNSHWLVGAEADYQWSNLDGSVSSSFRLGGVGATNMVASQTVESFGTVRARAGVVLAPPLLLYGTGGFAFGQVHENLRVPAATTNALSAGGFSYACTVGTACFAGSASQTLFGWSAGAGAEYAITTNLIFRTELLYVHLSSPTVTATATAVAAGTAPASIAAGFSPVYFAVMRAGLNYRF